MNNKKIAILLAAYNGEKYLIQQIDSVLNQSFSDFVLYIRDDNSTDSTKKIIIFLPYSIKNDICVK